MAKFYIRDFDSPFGFKQINRRVSARGKGWSQKDGYVPWGITDDDSRVIYAELGANRERPRQDSGILPYDIATSQSRRRLCQSELGVHALNPMIVGDSVQKVSRGVKRYLLARAKSDDQAQKTLVKKIGHYFYSSVDRKTKKKRINNGFGRLSQALVPNDPNVFWKAILQALDQGLIEQQLSIHDAIGRKLLHDTWKEKQLVYQYKKVLAEVRPDWFDLSQYRGRARQMGRTKPTESGGIVRSPQEARRLGLRTNMGRNRGIDMFLRSGVKLRTPEERQRYVDDPRRRSPEPDEQYSLENEQLRLEESSSYYSDLDERNLLFSAGPSGTTGTLLAAALTIGGLKRSSEDLKEYAMAICGYLVGGGMHSYHEEMRVAAKMGVPYSAGAYLPSMPKRFLTTLEFSDWLADYYDIVRLGGIHWLYAGSDVRSAGGPKQIAELRKKVQKVEEQKTALRVKRAQSYLEALREHEIELT